MPFTNLKLAYDFTQSTDYELHKQMRALIVEFLGNGGTIVWCPNRKVVDLSGYTGSDVTIAGDFSPILIYGVNERIELCMIDKDELDGLPCVILAAAKYCTFDAELQAKMASAHGYFRLFDLLFN